ncbi:pimeloyl-ACP methyl ester carboxylesterase [Streptomyces olivoverticillatus]|uniref:Pimeloyl-ACP methyl ester carboxylesterase n=1 Tax=Streptomyces olivoverticillatus TaxID=66427 RepID=A0A7W7LPC7_9ACTN|nr:alpha/beta hydrolase-fold protein [Streptomyces olivoverticillatus]MBB4893970.1 pimeloyl-ACP methyl ester carboxylesterase [Streptomyces olivoverticillatus]
MSLSLTGTAFFALLIAACVLAVVAALLLWPKIPGPRPVRWLGRIALIGLCQATAICVVAVWINSSYGLYASWSDLFGRTGDTGPVAMPGPPAQRAKFTRGDNGIRETYFRGSRSKLSGQVMVWTPPQYDEPAYRHTAFPVVLLLHGVPGSPQSWMEQGKMPGAYERLLKAGGTRPFILAVPIINPGGVDTDCSDVRDRKVATWLASDVPELVRSHFRTGRAPHSWGVLGISTGGFCAVKLPLQYPKVFGAGVGLDPDPLDGTGSTLSDPELRRRNSPTRLVRDSKADVGLFLATSRQDRVSPPRYIEEFQREAAGSRVRLKTMLLATGGHNYGTWITLYPAAFGWLGEELGEGPG